MLDDVLSGIKDVKPNSEIKLSCREKFAYPLVTTVRRTEAVRTEVAPEKVDDRVSEYGMIEGTASSTSVDFYGTEMSYNALDSMSQQMIRGLPILPRHQSLSGDGPAEWDEVIGRTMSAEILPSPVVNPADPSERGFVLRTTSRLYDDAPLAAQLTTRLNRGEPIGQSIGGWFLSVRVLTDDEGEVHRIIVEDVELDHVAITRAPANPDSNGLLSLRSRIEDAIRSTPSVREVPSFGDLPLADMDKEWNWDSEASNDVLGDPPDWDRYKAAHAYCDPEELGTKAGYKLPFAMMVDGKLTAVWRGIAAAMGALLGARGGVDIPANERKKVYDLLARYYKKAEKEPPPFRSKEDADMADETRDVEKFGAAIKIASPRSGAEISRDSEGMSTFDLYVMTNVKLGKNKKDYGYSVSVGDQRVGNFYSESAEINAELAEGDQEISVSLFGADGLTVKGASDSVAIMSMAMEEYDEDEDEDVTDEELESEEQEPEADDPEAEDADPDAAEEKPEDEQEEDPDADDGHAAEATDTEEYDDEQDEAEPDPDEKPEDADEPDEEEEEEDADDEERSTPTPAGVSLDMANETSYTVSDSPPSDAQRSAGTHNNTEDNPMSPEDLKTIEEMIQRAVGGLVQQQPETDVGGEPKTDEPTVSAAELQRRLDETEAKLNRLAENGMRRGRHLGNQISPDAAAPNEWRSLTEAATADGASTLANIVGRSAATLSESAESTALNRRQLQDLLAAGLRAAVADGLLGSTAHSSSWR